jgi:hypothetical protein
MRDYHTRTEHAMSLPPGDDRINRVARAIFAYRWPRASFSDPLFKAERDDCRLLAVQFKEMFAEHWTLENAAELLTDKSCQLVFGENAFNTNTRAQVKDFAESYLEDLAKVFHADLRAGSESWKHIPEDEPDDSELEVIIAKKASVN